jgi:Uma2 family endonuclease
MSNLENVRRLSEDDLWHHAGTDSPMTGRVTGPEMSLEEYLRTNWEPDAEFVDGIVEYRMHGEMTHGRWQAAVMLWFYDQAVARKIEVFTSLRVLVAETRMRVPDVCIVDAASDSSTPDEDILTRPPIGVFEILSPADTAMRPRRKLRDYAAMGIPQIWVVDPEDRTWMRYQNGVLSEKPDFRFGEMVFQWSEVAKLVR